jgi:AcrR family transcriptional regulator
MYVLERNAGCAKREFDGTKSRRFVLRPLKSHSYARQVPAAIAARITERRQEVYLNPAFAIITNNTIWYIFILTFVQAIQHVMTKAEKTRAYIIEKAAPIFNMKGFAGTSMADLTQATGLTKGAIYGNFRDKDEVAIAVYEYNLSLVMKGLRRAAETEETMLGKLRAMTEFHRRDFKRVLTCGGCPVLNTAVEADDSHPLLRQRAADTILSWKNSIERIVSAGKTNGEIRQDTDGEAFAAAYIALIEGGIMLSKATGNESLLGHCLDRIAHMIADLKA